MSEMSKVGAGFKGGLRLGDLLLSVRGQLCTSPEQTIGMLREMAGPTLVFVERPPPEKKGFFGGKK